MGTIPALTNKSVGSFFGISDADGCTVWPRSLKKSRNDCRIFAVVQRMGGLFYPSVRGLPTGVRAGIDEAQAGRSNLYWAAARASSINWTCTMASGCDESDTIGSGLVSHPAPSGMTTPIMYLSPAG